MAVTQISQIQVRWGLQSDIGQLAAGEFAWAVDTQKLYIGNGTVEEGAPLNGITEIITGAFDATEMLGNYTYRGNLGGYEVVTGVDESTPVVRSFQYKIDDFVNVRDFGASGSGNVDDTAAIQRALYELYSRQSATTGQKTRRALRFNAGTYRIDGSLAIPPYVTLIGEGMDNVKLVFTNGSASLTTTTGTDPGVFSTIPKYPYAVNISGMTFQTQSDTDIFKIDGSTNIVFSDVAFVGPRSLPTTLTNGRGCVRIKSTVKETSGIYFSRCTFTGMSYAAHISAATGTGDVVFDDCQFNELVYAVYTDSSVSAPHKIKISKSVFKDIFNSAIYGAEGVTGIISTGNTFKNVGSRYQGDESALTAWYPVIVFQADNNYSISDLFDRSIAASVTYPRVSSSGFSTVYLSVDEWFGLGTARTLPGRQYSLANGQAFTLPVQVTKHGIINYSAVRDNSVRSGSIKFSSTDNAVVYDDEYTETSDIGLDLQLVVSNDTVNISGTTTDTGSITTLNFDVKTLS